MFGIIAMLEALLMYFNARCIIIDVMFSAVRQLASGDDQEFECFMAIVNIGETCGANPFEDPSIINMLISSPLSDVCR